MFEFYFVLEKVYNKEVDNFKKMKKEIESKFFNRSCKIAKIYHVLKIDRARE